MFLSALSDNQKEAFMCLAHNVVVSDGDLTIEEQAMMEEMRREMELSPSFKATYLDIEGIEGVFDSKRTRTIVLLSLIRLGYADGAFEIEEQCFLRDLSGKFDISEKDFTLIDNWAKRLLALEREAKGFL